MTPRRSAETDDELSRVLSKLMLRDVQARKPSASRDVVAVLTGAGLGLDDVTDDLIEEIVSDRPRAAAVLIASLKFGLEA